MFRWYRKATVCFVYLSDVYLKDGIAQSRWFIRGWTLKELIAPKVVEFFSQEKHYLGTKESLVQVISAVTRIQPAALLSVDLYRFSVQDRMKCATGRQTTIEEDEVYCLLGIFGVYMPLIYGEGREHAFKRLYRESNPSTCCKPCDRSSSPESDSASPFEPQSASSQSTYHSCGAQHHIGGLLHAGAQFYARAQYYARAQQYAGTTASSKTHV